MADFLTDVQTLRERARSEMDKGPVTDAYGADLARVLEVCNEALATEVVCTLRYRRHYYTALGLAASEVAAEFAQHASEEQQHADLLAERITQLGGEPDFNPATLLGRSHSEYDDSPGLLDMVRENLVAERIAIASYTEIVNWIGSGDPTTRRLFESILATEEEHADDMLSFVEKLQSH
jgi:bacterioferritin